MVLGGEDDDGRVGRKGAGQQVPRIGRRAGEDHQVVLAGADEAGDLLAGLLVPLAGHAAGEAVAAVDRGVGAQGALDGLRDDGEGRGRRLPVSEVR